MHGVAGTARRIENRAVFPIPAGGCAGGYGLVPSRRLVAGDCAYRSFPQQLEAVIVHELAHIKRFDCFVNLFQIAVETLLFYHPAVWWVSRSIRTERENCCDDIAIAVCGNVGDYARALTLMETWRATPALVLAANSGSLRSRISRLLGLQTITRSVPGAGLAAIGLLCAAGAVLAGATFNRSFSYTADLTPSSGSAGPAKHYAA